MKIVRTDSNDKEFIRLVSELDQMLAVINGEDHSFYNQFNTLTEIRNVILVYEGDTAIACGAFKKFDDTSCEIKRMFTEPSHRGRGYAGIVVDELEKWARESGYRYMVLETSVKLKSAVRLYQHKGYTETEKYGQYKDAIDSMCFRKAL
jgi:GNAT superfamily N-acetyltransferase